MAVRPQTACPLPPIPYADWHSFGRTGRTSPMILTNTRFRRRPSNSGPAIPLERSAPRCQSRGGHWSPPPPPRAPIRAGVSRCPASGAGRGLAVVKGMRPRRCGCVGIGWSARGAPALPATSRSGVCKPRSSSLMNTLAVMCGSTGHCMALTGTSAVLVAYRTRAGAKARVERGGGSQS